MSVDFQGGTQTQSDGGLTVSSCGMYARRLAESAAAGGDRVSAGGDSVLLEQGVGKPKASTDSQRLSE